MVIQQVDIVVTYVTHNFGGAWKFKEMAMKQKKIVAELRSY